MRVFVLNTGRCGSKTFSEACRHLTNYTSGHESIGLARYGDSRFAYPDRHIEVDNRLSWFLTELGTRFDDDETFYVHLTRDPDAVARSFLARWDRPFRASIITAFGHGILKNPAEWDPDERLAVCRFYVDVVNRAIADFVARRPRTMHVRVETVDTDFPRFLEAIGAEGALDAAMDEWGVRHNASQPA